jgi:hypothetical protein
VDGIEAFVTALLVIGGLIALLLLVPVAIAIGGVAGLALASGLVH